MQFIKDNIHIIIALIVIIILVIFLIWWNKRKTKPSLKNKINSMNKSATTSPGWPNENPGIYGNQNVVKDSNGIWKLAIGTCSLYVNGIIDWEKIQSMSNEEQEQLEIDIDNCKGENLPLIQPK